MVITHQWLGSSRIVQCNLHSHVATFSAIQHVIGCSSAWQCRQGAEIFSHLVMVGQIMEVTQLREHLVSGVCGCDSRPLEAVRRTGLLWPTLLPAASTCTGGSVSFSLRRSRARSALQLQVTQCTSDPNLLRMYRH
jgi:hypothetical protein